MNNNTQKTKSLRSRILLTISLLSLVRIGTFLPLPYIDKEGVTSLPTNLLLEGVNNFSGIETKSLLSLGITPYINASIIIQLLTTAIPSLSKMQKEEGEYGRRILTNYTRYLTLVGAIILSIISTYDSRKFIFDWSFWTATQIILSLVTGSMIALWFSERITKNGLGNGSSLLICFNIVSSLPDQIKLFYNNQLILFGIVLLTTIGCIYMNEAIIRIPLISARQLLKKKTSHSKKFGNSTLPLRVNQAGVMPLIFTSYAMGILIPLVLYLKSQTRVPALLNQISIFNEAVWFWIGKILFCIIFASLTFFFTYFYSTITFDPEDIAEKFRKNSVIILGIRPGKATRSYLRKILKRIARIHALFLISNIFGLQILESILHINLTGLRGGLGFTSQLILVNVLMETIQKIKSFANENKKTI